MIIRPPPGYEVHGLLSNCGILEEVPSFFHQGSAIDLFYNNTHGNVPLFPTYSPSPKSKVSS